MNGHVYSSWIPEQPGLHVQQPGSPHLLQRCTVGPADEAGAVKLQGQQAAEQTVDCEQH